MTTQVQNGKVEKARSNVQLGVPTGKAWNTQHEEFLPALRGRRAVRVYREMSDNDDTVSEILFAIEMLLRQSEWSVEKANEENPADIAAAEFLEECQNDMSHSWPDFIATVLTELAYGWSGHEIVYKQRDGVNSKYDDQKVGWAKFAYQPQSALDEWEYDNDGGIAAFKWTGNGNRGRVPIEKFLLFRTTTARGPNGRSVLRGAYRSWWFKKRLEDLVVIAADKDANGVMKAGIPLENIIARDSLFDEAAKVVTAYHRDEQAGFVWPRELDEEGNELWTLEIMRSEVGSSIEAMRGLITMFAQNIAGVVLADFVRLGRDSVGSRALAEPKQELFQTALQGWLDGIAEVLNRFAVPRLFELNNFNVTELPRFVPEEVADINLGDLGSFIKDTSQAGMDWGFLNNEDPITDQVREKAGFDKAPELELTQPIVQETD